MRIFVINLAASTDRWEAIRDRAAHCGLSVERVPALDGRTIPPAERSRAERSRFRRFHGRTMLAGEYGCYLSHLAAIDAFLATNDPFAVICEDDVRFSTDLVGVVEAAFDTKPDMELLKLVNHRTSGFVTHAHLPDGHRIGRCLHGPLGSAACYALSRSGAAKLRGALATMWLPFDVALERGWATGVATYTLADDLIGFDASRLRSTITEDPASSYAASKASTIRRSSTLVFRAVDYCRRAIYALKR